MTESATAQHDASVPRTGASLEVCGLEVSVGQFALRDVSFAVPAGDYFVLLGPTGSGKTLLIETLCGLRRPDAGRVLVGERDITALDPARRNIGYVPQDYALLPFLTVRQNVGFGLKAHRVGRPLREKRVDEILDLLRIAKLAGRLPARLSGGERQRVALGRALAIEPDLLLLDEPLSAVDDSTGDALMDELLRIHRHQRTTTIHICHRLEEAFRMASRLGLMNDGRIVQHGPAGEVIAKPSNLFVAQFLKLANLLEGEVRGEGASRAFYLGDAAVAKTDLAPGPAWGYVTAAAVTASRSRPPSVDGHLTLPMRVLPPERHPGRPALRLGDGRHEMTLPGIYPEAEWPEGANVYAAVQLDAIRVLKRS